MQQRIDLVGALATRVRGACDGTVLLGEQPISESGGWMHIPVALATQNASVIECSVRVRVSVDGHANRCLYVEQIEIAGRRFGGLASLTKAFGQRLAESIPHAVAEQLQRWVSAQVETQPDLAVARNTVPQPPSPSSPKQSSGRVTRVWGL